jgi:hypothetical protein
MVQVLFFQLLRLAACRGGVSCQLTCPEVSQVSSLGNLLQTPTQILRLSRPLTFLVANCTNFRAVVVQYHPVSQYCHSL